MRSQYLPIERYALIGDCHGSALVSETGSIDWCCLGRFDAPPICWRLLDVKRGGYFSIAPLHHHAATRAYLGNTNLLRTTFSDDTGIASVTDFMPVGRRAGTSTHDYVRLAAPHCVVRIVECLQGCISLKLEVRLSAGLDERELRPKQQPGVVSDQGFCVHHTLPALTLDPALCAGVFKLRAGERAVFALMPEMPDTLRGDLILRNADYLRDQTRAFWEEWAAYCRYDGPYRGAVMRSALALKLLTFAPSGALVAAPTASLPAWIGGTRNWDYRYCWLRDSAFTLYALAVLGYGGEARCFSEFLKTALDKTCPELQTIYGISGETELHEIEHQAVEGYAASRPVRTGNGAFRQHQADVYGEVLDWALLYVTIGGKLDDRTRKHLRSIADRVAHLWRRPDQSLWEVRSGPRHHVHSKLMSWVALDRAVRLLGPDPHWLAQRNAILHDLLRHGLAPEGYLRQAYGADATDASLLLASMLGLPIDAGVHRRTVAAVEQQLRSGRFVFRYRSDDGVQCDEGAFVICSFWLVDALLQLGRHSDAKQLFEELLRSTNEVGLLGEGLDPVTGCFLGNFPQAFSHLALVQAAIHLDLYERLGPAALTGSHADRARRAVTATLGWRGWWAAVKWTSRVGRVFPSRRSVLDPRLWAGTDAG